MFMACTHVAASRPWRRWWPPRPSVGGSIGPTNYPGADRENRLHPRNAVASPQPHHRHITRYAHIHLCRHCCRRRIGIPFAVASASLSHTSQGQPASQPSVVRQRVVGRRSFASRPPFQPLPTKRLHLAAPFGGRSGVCPLRYCCLRQPLRPPRVRTSLSSSGAQRSSATSCAVLRFLTVGSGARRGVKGLRAGFCLACEAA